VIGGHALRLLGAARHDGLIGIQLNLTKPQVNLRIYSISFILGNWIDWQSSGKGLADEPGELFSYTIISLGIADSRECIRTRDDRIVLLPIQIRHGRCPVIEVKPKSPDD
jgi:hypothetical protein